MAGEDSDFEEYIDGDDNAYEEDPDDNTQGMLFLAGDTHVYDHGAIAYVDDAFCLT